MSGQTSLSRWLRQEMPRRGYPLEGHRAGGITRLAADTGISQATMSRMVNGLAEPSVDSLRKIGKLWGYSLQQMMVFAGLAEPGDHEPVAHVSQVTLQAPEASGPAVRIEEVDDSHLRVGLTIETDVTMAEVYERLGGEDNLQANERAMIYNMVAMEFPPAEIGGAVMMLRGFDARRTGTQGSRPRRRA